MSQFHPESRRLIERLPQVPPEERTKFVVDKIIPMIVLEDAEVDKHRVDIRDTFWDALTATGDKELRKAAHTADWSRATHLPKK